MDNKKLLEAWKLTLLEIQKDYSNADMTTRRSMKVGAQEAFSQIYNNSDMTFAEKLTFAKEMDRIRAEVWKLG